MPALNEWWLWVGFFTFIAMMLWIDLFLLGGKKAHQVLMKESLSWVIVWVSLALLFNLLLWRYLSYISGPLIANQKALEFFTGYLIELSLSIDNMFIFISIFQYFSVPAEYQRRVLLFGVISAILMRFVIILLGIILVKKFHWILYFFGILLIYTGLKMLVISNEEKELSKNPILNLIRKYIKVTDSYCSEKFFVKINKVLYATPLFLVLILIEISDLIFAVDSIPAIFAITEDPFIIFTSNILAILGLRSLYFLLANMTSIFYYLRYGVALILIFIGLKMLIAYWFQLSIFYALTTIIIILISSIGLSLLKNKKA